MLYSLRFSHVGKLVALSTAMIMISACSGGGGSGTSPVPITQFCGNDTQYALARPLSGQAISTGTPTVEIVASGSNNQIAQSYRNFDLLFVPANGNGGTVATGSLSTAIDQYGYHPFTQDFYYNATIVAPGLAPSTLYNVYVNAFTSNCTPVGPIGQVGTQ